LAKGCSIITTSHSCTLRGIGTGQAIVGVFGMAGAVKWSLFVNFEKKRKWDRNGWQKEQVPGRGIQNGGLVGFLLWFREM